MHIYVTCYCIQLDCAVDATMHLAKQLSFSSTEVCRDILSVYFHLYMMLCVLLVLLQANRAAATL